MSNLILKTPALQIIEKSKAEKIKQTFEPMVKMFEIFEKNYNEVIKLSEKEITNEVTSKAKRLRIDIGKVRIETGKLKDKQKEYIKLEDKAIMGVHNIIIWAVKEKEDKLKEIEKHFEIQEQKRLEKLQNDRAEKLSKYVEDAFERDLAKFTDEEWTLYFSAKKKMYEDEQAAIKQAEKESIAKEKAKKEEQERIKKENARLKKEREERDLQLKLEAEKRAKIEAERIAKEKKEKEIREEKARKEKEVYELKLKKEREERERIEKEERLKREKLEAELKAKEEAEKKRLAEIEAKKQADLQKGDADKMHDFIIDLQDLKKKYNFKSQKYNRKYTDAKTLIDKIIKHIK